MYSSNDTDCCSWRIGVLQVEISGSSWNNRDHKCCDTQEIAAATANGLVLAVKSLAGAAGLLVVSTGRILVTTFIVVARNVVFL
jgi:hypothetical protein